MKLRKAIPAIIVSLCTTTLLHAQEVKTDIAKPIEVKIPPVASNKPSPQPALKQQPQVAATATDAPAAAAAPSPLTRKEDANISEKAKPVIKTVDDNGVVSPAGGIEGRKIMAGNTTTPTPEINNHSTIDLKPAPQVRTTKPANGQQQQ